MDFIQRTNKHTGLVETIAQRELTLDSIETTSRTNSNKKSFGFFQGKNELGATLTGMAYAKTASSYPDSLVSGSIVLIETLASNIIAGHNNRWDLALRTASKVSDDDMAQAKKALGL